MLKFFSKLRWIYYITSILGAIIIFCVLMWLNIAGGISSAGPLASFWILACALFFHSQGRKKMEQIFRYRELCQVKKYVSCLEKLLGETKSKKARDSLNIYLSAGYIDLGNPKKSLDLISDICPEDFNGRTKINDKIVYYNSLVSACIMLGKFQEAQAALRNMKSAIESPKLSAIHRNAYLKHWKTKGVLLDIEEGKVAGAEEHLLRELDAERSLLGKTSLCFRLGKLYLLLDDIEEASLYFTYAAENGGDTFYAKDAQRKLKILEE